MTALGKVTPSVVGNQGKLIVSTKVPGGNFKVVARRSLNAGASNYQISFQSPRHLDSQDRVPESQCCAAK